MNMAKWKVAVISKEIEKLVVGNEAVKSQKSKVKSQKLLATNDK
jgi:hypothetical protein